MLVGNGESCTILGKCLLNIRMFAGVMMSLTNVGYVSELEQKLILLSVLENQGYSFKCDKRLMEVKKGSLIVVNGV